MDVFISWSGERSRIIAQAFWEQMRFVVPDTTAFFSPEIEKGVNGYNEISGNLGKADFGIVCLTPENLHSTWINFEAGALSKHQQNARLWTVLFDLTPSEVPEPLKAFQHSLCTRDDLLKVFKSINSKVSTPSMPSVLNVHFNNRWRYFKKAIDAASDVDVTAKMKGQIEMLREILDRVETLDQKLPTDAIVTQRMGDLLRRLNSGNLHPSNTSATRLGGTPEDVNRRYGK